MIEQIVSISGGFDKLVEETTIFSKRDDTVDPEDVPDTNAGRRRNDDEDDDGDDSEDEGTEIINSQSQSQVISDLLPPPVAPAVLDDLIVVPHPPADMFLPRVYEERGVQHPEIEVPAVEGEDGALRAVVSDPTSHEPAPQPSDVPPTEPTIVLPDPIPVPEPEPIPIPVPPPTPSRRDRVCRECAQELFFSKLFAWWAEERPKLIEATKAEVEWEKAAAEKARIRAEEAAEREKIEIEQAASAGADLERMQVEGTASEVVPPATEVPAEGVAPVEGSVIESTSAAEGVVVPEPVMPAEPVAPVAATAIEVPAAIEEAMAVDGAAPIEGGAPGVIPADGEAPPVIATEGAEPVEPRSPIPDPQPPVQEEPQPIQEEPPVEEERPRVIKLPEWVYAAERKDCPEGRMCTQQSSPSHARECESTWYLLETFRSDPGFVIVNHIIAAPAEPPVANPPAPEEAPTPAPAVEDAPSPAPVISEPDAQTQEAAPSGVATVGTDAMQIDARPAPQPVDQPAMEAIKVDMPAPAPVDVVMEDAPGPSGSSRSRAPSDANQVSGSLVSASS